MAKLMELGHLPPGDADADARYAPSDDGQRDDPPPDEPPPADAIPDAVPVAVEETAANSEASRIADMARLEAAVAESDLFSGAEYNEERL